MRFWQLIYNISIDFIFIFVYVKLNWNFLCISLGRSCEVIVFTVSSWKILKWPKKYTEYQIQDTEEEEIFTTRCFFLTIKILPSKAFHCYVNVSNRG